MHKFFLILALQKRDIYAIKEELISVFLIFLKAIIRT